MNPVDSRPPRALSLWRLALPVSLVLILGLIVIGVTGFFRLSRDARCLRNSLTDAGALTPAAWHKKVELRVGAMTCYLVRAGLSYLEMPTEARAALSAVRGAEVGVYELSSGAGLLDHPEMLSAADEAMLARGWERVVGVMRESEMVAVYAPKGQDAVRELQACVAVLHRNQLVVVGGRSNLEPLLMLVRSRPEWGQQARWPVQL